MDIKQAYQEKMAAQLKEWQSKIDELKAKGEKLEAEQRIKYYEQIESLRLKQQHVYDKLEQMHNASEGAWEELKAGVELAWQDLKQAVEHARDRFRE